MTNVLKFIYSHVNFLYCRVRLFGKLRANVASLAPPTSMEYISEQRVFRGQHKLHFNCELFVERFVEYCFVYVSQAISGAVADVRMDCVPTLPISGKPEKKDDLLEYVKNIILTCFVV